jgi:hypothetical protein
LFLIAVLLLLVQLLHLLLLNKPEDVVVLVQSAEAIGVLYLTKQLFPLLFGLCNTRLSVVVVKPKIKN